MDCLCWRWKGDDEGPHQNQGKPRRHSLTTLIYPWGSRKWANLTSSARTTPDIFHLCIFCRCLVLITKTQPALQVGNEQSIAIQYTLRRAGLLKPFRPMSQLAQNATSNTFIATLRFILALLCWYCHRFKVRNLLKWLNWSRSYEIKQFLQAKSYSCKALWDRLLVDEFRANSSLEICLTWLDEFFQWIWANYKGCGVEKCHAEFAS